MIDKKKLFNFSIDNKNILIILFLLSIALIQTLIFSNILTTIPLILLLTIILKLKFNEDIVILGTCIILTSLISISTNLNVSTKHIAIINVSVFTTIISLNLFKEFINLNKQYAWTISVLGVLASIYIYSLGFGNPIEYIVFKNKAEEYLQEHYSDYAQISKVNVNLNEFNYDKSKFFAEFKNKNIQDQTFALYYDFEHKLKDTYLEYNKDNIIREVSNNIEFLIAENSNIKINDIVASVEIDLSDEIYRRERKYLYDSNIDVVSLVFDKNINSHYSDKNILYKNKEDFSEGVFNAVNILKTLKCKINKIEAETHFNNNGEWYEVDINNLDSISSPKDIEKNIKVNSIENIEKENDNIINS